MCLIMGGGGIMMKERKCTVIDEKAKVAPNLKGLQIKVGMNFCDDPKRANLLRKKIKKICQTTSNILIIMLNDMFYGHGSFGCSIMSKK